MDDMHVSFNPFANAGKSRWVKPTNWQAAASYVTSASKLQDQHLPAQGIEATAVSNKLAHKNTRMTLLCYNNSHLSSTLSVFNFSGMHNNNNNNNNNN